MSERPLTTRPGRRSKNNVLAGKDSYHVLGPAGELVVKGEKSHALVVAQGRALNAFDEPVTLTVERRSLFGPVAQLYRVVRDEHGAVLTFTLAQED